jgi:hypothetical protein
MGIEALYRRPRTTKPEPGHKIYMDITYIPMARGLVYLAVVLDRFSRRVLSWRVSITMEGAFCVETLEDTLTLHGKPDIFNTDRARSSPARRSPACSPSGSPRRDVGQEGWRPQRARWRPRRPPLPSTCGRSSPEPAALSANRTAAVLNERRVPTAAGGRWSSNIRLSGCAARQERRAMTLRQHQQSWDTLQWHGVTSARTPP